jgi:hypothetical protein
VFLIRCPVTGTGTGPGTDELVSERSVVAVANHPTHVGLTVRCPHGHQHVHRTVRRWEQARRDPGARQAEDLVGT